MIGVAALMFSYAGAAGLCAAMARHQTELVGRKLAPAEARRLRAAGSAALAAALACAMGAVGRSIGPVLWIGMVMLAGLVLTLLLPYGPQLARRTAVILGLFAPLTAAAGLIIAATA